MGFYPKKGKAHDRKIKKDHRWLTIAQNADSGQNMITDPILF
jgi:hypothetical protein